MDLGFSVRLPGGGNFAGGWSIGNSVQVAGSAVVAGGAVSSGLSRCFIVNNPTQVTGQASAPAAVGYASTSPCNAPVPYQNRFKINGSYPLRGSIQLAAVYQDLPGTNYFATRAFTSAEINNAVTNPGGQLINTSTGAVRNLLTGSATFDLFAPFSQFGDRVRQLDIRGSKTIKVGDKRLQFNVDVYNLTNSSVATAVRNNYTAPGAVTTTPWLQPTTVLEGRFAKFGIQLDF